MNLKCLDSYRPWIQRIEPISTGWRALVFPNHIFETIDIESLGFYISSHVLNEVIKLVGDFGDTTEFNLKAYHGKRDHTDLKMIAASIMYDRFPVYHKDIALSLNWKNHSSSIHATRQVKNIPELKKAKEKILKMYPFLNGERADLHA